MSVDRYQLDPSHYAHLTSSPQIIYLFSLFHEYGHSIRFVGGVVRDVLLGIEQHDIDFVTSARPDEMFNMIRGDSNIEHVYTRAEQFGTLTLVVGTTQKVKLRSKKIFVVQKTVMFVEGFSNNNAEKGNLS